MYILYLDESGEPSNWQVQKNFVIAGVSVHESIVENMRKRVEFVRDKYFPGIEYPIEFHATDIRNGKGIYRDFHLNVREEMLQDLYRTIVDNRFPLFAVFGATINIDAAQNPNQVRSDVFEEAICGFNTFLVWCHRLGHTNKGLIIIDKNKEEQYKQLLDNFRQNGTKYGYLGNVIDIPYFARCHETPMLQLADLCAYAIFRNYEKADSEYLNIILPRVYKTLDGKMFGLKHLTKTRPCSCISCVTQQTIL